MPLLSRLAVQAARAYGILSSKAGVSADYLVVAGGGGGGNSGGSTYGTTSGGGGGGAGGLTTSTFTLSTANTYTIVVGAGGSASGYSKGINSTISGTGLTTVTAYGGGLGGTAYYYNDMNGGSGGGAAYSTSAGTGTSGQGNNGASYTSGFEAGAGGGGAGAVGTTNTSDNGGAGGNGSASSISGSSVTYAGGGGGGGGYRSGSLGAAGGSGGGGAGGNRNTVGTAGTANLGGGGGGAGGMDPAGAVRAGGNGGSGIVIISYTSATPKFVGGTITTSGGKQIHTFTSSGTLSPITPITASYLVVAGGAGGGSDGGGGGGAGGLLTSSTTLYSGATYIVTVGAGGSGGTASGDGSSGNNSVVSGTGLTTLTATGGGGGGGFSRVGVNGGSGGGGGMRNARAGGTGTSGQGFAGGTSSTGTGEGAGGGGGGSSAVGGTVTNTKIAGNGGAGTASSITGTSTNYAGGGGGSTRNADLTYTNGTGGVGGGGNGALQNAAAGSGTPNSGGGGGGGDANSTGAGGAGGSGIVIISYAGSQQFNGGLVTTSGGNTIHTFTSTGALTPLTNNLNNSLRFRSSATANLTRTPTLTTNRRTYTWSSWVKRGALPSSRMVLFIGDDGTIYTYCAFSSSNQLEFYHVPNTSGTEYKYVTSAVFRDPSAWYHVVFAIDTTQATAGNRVKIYVNGVQQTISVTTAYGDIPQNTDTFINTNNGHTSFGWNRGSSPFDGYATDVNFIDGQALEPYYFGNNDANGVWKPIQYKGTYGTNGFYLTFGNTTSTTTLGYDSSPNGNNWTCNNISLTAGTTYDAMTDVPTNTSATVANYCTLNPLVQRWAVNAGVFSEANLKVTTTGSSSSFGFGTIFNSTGKWYWEGTLTAAGTATPGTGLGDLQCQSGTFTNLILYNKDGSHTGAGASWATYTTNDIIGVAMDCDGGNIYFYKNNTLQGSVALTAGVSYAPLMDVVLNATWAANFGQRPFSYTPPTGYVALNTYNLSTPTILQGNKYMDATLYTGQGVAQTVVNTGQFKPDFVWQKARAEVANHRLVDSVRGVDKVLYSSSTAAEATTDGVVDTFNSNGFTGGGSDVVTSGQTAVAWQWQAGQGSTSSNTSGTITSTVSVNTTAGFSVVTYTGTGSTKTFGHGLGVTPAMFIVKSRSQTGENWVTWHKSFSNTAQGNMALNTTDAVSNSASVWGNTAPTSTLITVGNAAVNNNTSTYVCYAWAEIAGFSKFGSYTGNGSTDGPFIFLGFRPKFVMIKRTDGGTNNWVIFDSSRNTYNATGKELKANTSAAEYDGDTTNPNDFLSNGLKIRHDGTAMNISSGTYIYMAFAENPFKNANAR